MSSEATCYKCSAPLTLELGAKVGRHEECPKCYANVRCCKMCSFYDPSAYNECKEPMANRILEKESANFCDYYKLGALNNQGNDKDDLMAAANALFKS